MLRMTALGACFLALAGCTPSAQVALTGASLVSLAHTDKTVGDHVSTWAFDKDCSLIQFINGEEYCQDYEDEAAKAASQPVLHCYRTIGGVSCYERPDRSASAQTKVYSTPDFQENIAVSKN